MLKAVRDEVIVRQVYVNKIGNSTLVIPESFGIKENLMEYYGEIISIGPDFVSDKIDIGDKLLYYRNEGVKIINEDGEEFLSLKPRALLCKID